MSFLTIPFNRLKNTSNSYETTEMTQIVNLDSFMALMDGRKILDNHEEDDDMTSISTDNTDYMNEQPSSTTGVKYNYQEEDEDELAGDEAEQSLVKNDLESGSIKKVDFFFFCFFIVAFLFTILNLERW